MKKKKIKRIIIAAAALVIAVLVFDVWGFVMETVNYSVSTNKLKKNLNVVFVSDLHNSFFGGTDQSGLWEAINASRPDIVIFGGDVIDAWSGTKYSLDIMKKVHDSYPCVYTPGNHEEMRSDKEEFYEDVREIGIPILMGEGTEIEAGGEKVCIYGVLTANHYGKNATQLQECYSQLNTECYNILLAHEPQEIDRLLEGGDKYFDLILSGHAHGGQWRLPYILDQGLYAPDQGIFPKYTCGQYTYDKTTHIISRGLAKPMRMIFIPRIFNHPELTVVEVSCEK